MKAIPHFLVASALIFGSACSSTSDTTTGTGTTSGSETASSTGMDATSGNSTSPNTPGTGVVGTSTETAGRTGYDQQPGTGPAPGASNMSADAGTGMSADMTAFMGTFASMQDPVFLMNAASSNMLEIQAGQLASQKANNADVKKFGQMMVSHHTKATQELKTVAAPLGVTLPTAMMPVHQAMADRLMNKSGKDFDEAYMDMMETAHKMDIAMFEVKSKQAEKPAVQAFATKTLPMLRSHHTMADELEKKVD
ncbi:hypothetical protein GCM10023185_17960 [Hymenobacter saemangeumensis]|uniref:DUF4142 domain-containing protein n=1 Tax=Hymenobacter saemangeumensis TaxID=1084522 RepID=A0ABP8IBB4_9BACT